MAGVTDGQIMVHVPLDGFGIVGPACIVPAGKQQLSRQNGLIIHSCYTESQPGTGFKKVLQAQRGRGGGV